VSEPQTNPVLHATIMKVVDNQLRSNDPPQTGQTLKRLMATGHSEKEAKRLIAGQLALPAYEMVLKAAHTFNLLDARGAISVTERAAYIGRIRNLARSVSQAYFDSRLRSGFPMSNPEQLHKLGLDVAAMKAALVEKASAP